MVPSARSQWTPHGSFAPPRAAPAGGLGAGVEPHPGGTYSAWASAASAGLRGQHRQDLAQGAFHLARARPGPARLPARGQRPPGRWPHPWLEHEQGQLKPAPRRSPRLLLPSMGTAPVLQGPATSRGRWCAATLPAVRPGRRRWTGAAADELHDLEQAVSAAQCFEQNGLLALMQQAPLATCFHSRPPRHTPM